MLSEIKLLYFGYLSSGHLYSSISQAVGHVPLMELHTWLGGSRVLNMGTSMNN
jgi:hypothetical protein